MIKFVVEMSTKLINRVMWWNGNASKQHSIHKSLLSANQLSAVFIYGEWMAFINHWIIKFVLCLKTAFVSRVYLSLRSWRKKFENMFTRYSINWEVLFNGLLGLFAGVSFLTLIETLYSLIIRPLSDILKKIFKV